jgi:hypothetical protein
MDLAHSRLLAGTPEEREHFDKLLREHNELQMAERLAAKESQDFARTHPHRQLDLVVDGMGGNTILPHCPKISKKLSGVPYLKMLVTGMLVLSAVTMRFMFAGLYHFPHNEDPIITIIHFTLLNFLLQRRYRPSVLVLHLDNCFKENKNAFMLAYICFLVHQGFFAEVELRYLITGHTHGEIDSLFSNIRKCSWGTVAHTLTEYLQMLQSVYHRLSCSGTFYPLFPVIKSVRPRSLLH